MSVGLNMSTMSNSTSGTHAISTPQPGKRLSMIPSPSNSNLLNSTDEKKTNIRSRLTYVLP